MYPSGNTVAESAKSPAHPYEKRQMDSSGNFFRPMLRHLNTRLCSAASTWAIPITPLILMDDEIKVQKGESLHRCGARIWSWIAGEGLDGESSALASFRIVGVGLTLHFDLRASNEFQGSVQCLRTCCACVSAESPTKPKATPDSDRNQLTNSQLRRGARRRNRGIREEPPTRTTSTPLRSRPDS